MNISAIQTGVAANLRNLHNSTNYQASKSNSFEQIKDTYTESDETSLFRDIVQKYDITCISRNEANQMYKELMDNGLMSFKDYALCTLDTTKIPGWQNGTSSISGWKLSSEPDQKMNFLEGYKTQADFNKRYGNPAFQSNFDQMLALAEKIHFFQS